MTEAAIDATPLECRQALEALRNGVPNRPAVRILGCNQSDVETRFRSILDTSADRHAGMLVSGDFGAGKSHILTYFEQVALAAGYVCSRVAISKETPLYDLGKVVAAAVDGARIPGRNGRMVEELASVLSPGSAAVDEFVRWTETASADGTLSPMFPATVAVHQRSGDPELRSAIEAFWSGDRILISRVRAGLREIGELSSRRFRAPRASDLPAQRLRFLIELIKSAGYRGWVVLLDEIELIGSYSVLQRGRAYAETARWLGQSPTDSLASLAVVGTVTEDFASAVISADGKQDCDYVGPRLENSARHAHLAPVAETGMRCLLKDCTALHPPSDADVVSTLDRLRQIYSRAYDWDAPTTTGDAGGAGFEARMRYKVRTAINRWDLGRLVPDARPETESKEFQHGFGEDPDLDHDDDD